MSTASHATVTFQPLAYCNHNWPDALDLGQIGICWLDSARPSGRLQYTNLLAACIPVYMHQ